MSISSSSNFDISDHKISNNEKPSSLGRRIPCLRKLLCNLGRVYFSNIINLIIEIACKGFRGMSKSNVQRGAKSAKI